MLTGEQKVPPTKSRSQTDVPTPVAPLPHSARRPGFTPRRSARKRGSNTFLLMIPTEPSISDPRSAQLILAVQLGNRDTAATLLADHVSPNVEDHSGTGLLYLAAKCRNQDMFDLLISRDADPGRAIYQAVLKRDLPAFQFLEERGIPVERALVVAAELGDIWTARFVHGGDPGRADRAIAMAEAGSSAIEFLRGASGWPWHPRHNVRDWNNFVEGVPPAPLSADRMNAFLEQANRLEGIGGGAAADHWAAGVTEYLGLDPRGRPQTETVAGLAPRDIRLDVAHEATALRQDATEPGHPLETNTIPPRRLPGDHVPARLGPGPQNLANPAPALALEAHPAPAVPAPRQSTGCCISM